jgi:hypothetical protein
VAELEACRAELDGRGDEGATMIVPPARRRPRAARRRERRIPVAPLLILLAGALLAVGAYLLLREDDSGSAPPGSSQSEVVRLAGVATEDPTGDGEHDEAVARATDGDPATYWTTETYRSFDKPGVGLVVDTGEPVALSRLVVASTTPGFPATIRASGSPTGDFVAVSDQQEVGERTEFRIDTGGQDFQYYEIWLQLPDGGAARINEVTARS